jgi:hypothetical protein
MADQGPVPEGIVPPTEPKRRWEPPTIEEIDYDATAAGLPLGAADLGVYSG